jgi:hypothetical protein
VAALNIVGGASDLAFHLLVGLAAATAVGWVVKTVASLLPHLLKWDRVDIAINRPAKTGPDGEARGDLAEAMAITAAAEQLETSLEAAQRDRFQAARHLSDARQYSAHLARLIKGFALKSVDYAREGERLEAALTALGQDNREALVVAAARMTDETLRELILTRAGGRFEASLTELLSQQAATLREWGDNYDQLAARLTESLAQMKHRLVSLEAIYEATEVAEPLTRIQAHLDGALLHLSLDHRPGLGQVVRTLPPVGGRLLKV